MAKNDDNRTTDDRELTEDELFDVNGGLFGITWGDVWDAAVATAKWVAKKV